jgi:hypothetical protein
MTQLNYIRLSCSDQEALDDLMTEGWANELSKEHEVRFTRGECVVIISKWAGPIKEVRQISREHPELTFTVELTYETDEHPVTHVLEFLNGKERLIYQRPNYSVEFYPPSQYISKPFDAILDQAMNIFSRVDVRRDVDGILRVDPVLQPILVTIEEAEYRVKFLEQGFKVEVAECLKRRPGIPGKWNDLAKELKGGISL